MLLCFVDVDVVGVVPGGVGVVMIADVVDGGC